MPHKPASKKPAQTSPVTKDWGVEFLQVSLPADVKAMLDTKYAWSYEQVFDLMDRLSERGIKISTSFNEKNGAYMVTMTFTQKKGTPDESKVCFSSFGPDTGSALRVAFAKHIHIFDGDPERWQNSAELADLYG